MLAGVNIFRTTWFSCLPLLKNNKILCNIYQIPFRILTSFVVERRKGIRDRRMERKSGKKKKRKKGKQEGRKRKKEERERKSKEGKEGENN